MSVDLYLEVVRLLPLNAVPFIELLQFRRLVRLGGLVSLSVLHQPVGVGLPDEAVEKLLWNGLKFPTAGRVLGILPSRCRL